jgi:hypothetical protein
MDSAATRLDAHQLFDQVADNGEALTRGYLELVLDEQHCEGASLDNGDGSTNLTLTLLIKDQNNVSRDHHVFATRVRDDEATPDIKRSLLLKLMDRLTEKHGASTFVQPGELDRDIIQAFRDEVEYATVSWVT